MFYFNFINWIINCWFLGICFVVVVMVIFWCGWLYLDVFILIWVFIVFGFIFWSSVVIVLFFFVRFGVVNGLYEVMFYLLYGIFFVGYVELSYVYKVFIYCLSYFVMVVLVVCVVVFWSMFGVFKRWNMCIRDEVYLIGERLYNFGVLVGNSILKGKVIVWRGVLGRI